jgi:SecD/SecF fusion protein
MQLKGLIKIVTLIIILICLHQLSYTFFVGNFESKQMANAKSAVMKANPTLKEKDPIMVDKITDRYRYLLDSLGTQKVAWGMPYNKAKDHQLKLGLDLQGGMNVVLEVGTDELIRKYSNNTQDPALKAAIATAVQKRPGSGANFVDLFVNAYTAQNPNGRLSSLFSKAGREGITAASSNDQVASVLKNEAAKAVKNTYEVIRKRIDKFGVASPTINLDENKDIITVELAGVQNPEKVRQLLTSSAKLEFWETYSNYELTDAMENANKALATYFGATTKDTANKDAVKKDSSLLGGNLGGDSVKKQAELRKENPLYVLLSPTQPVQGENGKLAENPVIGYVANRDKDSLLSYFNLSAVRSQFPANFKILFGRPSAKELEEGAQYSYVYGIKTQPGSEEAPLGGENVKESRSDFSMVTNEPEITMQMDQTGANKWAKLTTANVGKPIAIALDGIVYSAPAPREPIMGGSSSISGSFSKEEADDVASILSSGRVEAPASIVQEQVVGPTLGAENIKAGKLSFCINAYLLQLSWYGC